MPELPEIESIKKQLENFLIGHRIEKVEVIRKNTFPSGKNKLLRGKIVGIRRFGKVIAVDLDNNYSILIHLKLTGQIIYRGPNLKNPPQFSKRVFGGAPGPHTKVIFNLDRNGKLYYNDFRGFGWIKVIKTDEINKENFISKLGPDALYKLSLDYLEEIASKTKRPIKVLLMDQSKISGIGNIYASEILFHARIDPRRPANSLKPGEVEAMVRAIPKVLSQAIAHRGTTFSDYRDARGERGGFQEFLLVYHREGKPCKVCGTPIRRIRLGGRSTFFCPRCQR